MKKDMRLVQCTVNGKEVAEYVDVRESLLDMLRNRLGLTSVKKGCEVGECGACTVIIDGETIDSCIYLAVWAEGKNIRTLEGLEKNGELTRIQEAFIEEGAIQCGFCTPGFVMSATVLLERGEKLTRDAIRKHMAGNLCRCTGYENIVNAVEKVLLLLLFTGDIPRVVFCEHSSQKTREVRRKIMRMHDFCASRSMLL